MARLAPPRSLRWHASHKHAQLQRNLFWMPQYCNHQAPASTAGRGWPTQVPPKHCGRGTLVGRTHSVRMISLSVMLRVLTHTRAAIGLHGENGFCWHDRLLYDPYMHRCDWTDPACAFGRLANITNLARNQNDALAPNDVASMASILLHARGATNGATYCNK